MDDLRKKIISKSNWKQNDNYNFNIYVSPEQFALLQKIPKDSVDLGGISDFTLGITPYDKYKGHSQELIKSRGFHSDIKESDVYKPLISGGNIKRYFVSGEIKEYIKYGKWLGAPRDERFFNSPRVLIPWLDKEFIARTENSKSFNSIDSLSLFSNLTKAW